MASDRINDNHAKSPGEQRNVITDQQIDISRLFPARPARRSNIEDNDETTRLLGIDTNAKTPWRQHDSAWIRVPTQTCIALWNLALGITSTIFSAEGLVLILLVSCIVLTILLVLELRSGGVPIGKALALAASAIALSIVSRLRGLSFESERDT